MNDARPPLPRPSSGKAAFLFGVHDHQPLGNFPKVLEHAYLKAYLPFLEVAEPRPWFRFTCHVSGCLWDWILESHPEFVERLKVLVKRGQVEMLSGGYYEPIFPVIPEADLIGQIEKLSDFIYRTFGTVPRGAWLTERVWEPHLPDILRRAGISYTLVDDWHLKGAGVPERSLHGPFITDHLGKSVRILAVDEKLRYLVPFREPELLLEYMATLAGPGDPPPAAVLVDDGEKFGEWPETHDWVYTRGWMDRFLGALEASLDWVEMRTCGEYVSAVRAAGPVYMGTASYSEMMEWVLPPAAQRAYEEGRAALKAGNAMEAAAPFLKGGTWRGFQSRYPEANWLHKKMLRVSGKVAAAATKDARDPRVAGAREKLWQGQCNCPYWHGIFGGLYLNYLRTAVWGKLVEAEALADRVLNGDGPWLEHSREDVDSDGAEEIIVEGDQLSVVFKPSEGGSASSWEIREKGWNILDTLGRRPEAYHSKLKDATDKGEVGKSIHEQVRAKEKGLEEFLSYDVQPRRGALQDHLLASDTELGDVIRGLGSVADLPSSPYRAVASSDGSGKARTVRVAFEGRARAFEGDLAVGKSVSFRAGSREADVRYRLAWNGPRRLSAIFAVEWNLGLLAGDAPDRYFLADGARPDDPRAGSTGSFKASLVEVVEGWRGARVSFRFDSPVEAWRHPVWTVSLSEAGFERTYQHTALYFLHRLALEPGGALEFSFAHSVVDCP
jgi:alpha-amylase